MDTILGYKAVSITEYEKKYDGQEYYWGITPNRRERFIQNLKEHTAMNGIHAINVFVKKPFIEDAPDSEEAELRNEPWYSGELMRYYHDWIFNKYEEEIFDCNSGGIPHKHCMNRMVAENFHG